MALPSLARLSLRREEVPTRVNWKDEKEPHDYPPLDWVEAENDACPICLEKLQSENDRLGPPVRVCPVRRANGALEGGHVLHRECYKQTRNVNNRCPECRVEMKIPDEAPLAEEKDPDGRLRSRTYDRYVVQYEGVKGQERKARVLWPNGVVFYEGPKGHEHMTRQEESNGGRVLYFEGAKGEERAVRQEFPPGDDRVIHFEGPRRQERKVRIEYPNNLVQHFEGPQGEERLKRQESPVALIYFAGSKSFERKIMTVDRRNNNVLHYNGPREQERLVNVVLADGAVIYYRGEAGEERKVKRIDASGTTFFEGQKGRERKVEKLLIDGTVQHFWGPKGEETEEDPEELRWSIEG